MAMLGEEGLGRILIIGSHVFLNFSDCSDYSDCSEFSEYSEYSDYSDYSEFSDHPVFFMQKYKKASTIQKNHDCFGKVYRRLGNQ